MKMSVVILDTDPLIEAMVLDCVGESQAELEMVSETHAAKSFIESQDVTLVVVNADLPKGWRFCTELKRDQATAHIPLMILSGKATEEVFHEHQKLPTRADAYLKKPVLIDQFRLAVLAVLKGEVMDVEIDVDLGIESSEITEVNVDESVLDATNSSDPALSGPPSTPSEVVASSLGPDPFLPNEDGPVTTPFDDIALSASAEELHLAGSDVGLSIPEPAAIEAPISESLGLEPPASIPEPPASIPEPPASIPEPPASIPEPPVADVGLLLEPEPSASIDAGLPADLEALDEISQERDFLKARVDELSQTGRALESAQTGQAQETELLRRQIEALQAERDVLEESKKRLATDLEMSHQTQTDLKRALDNARQSSVAEQDSDAGYVQSLETHIDQLHAVVSELSQQALLADTELRTALATYQEREAALTQMRESENRLTDTLLAVVEHVYEGLDLLRQDIHNGVPELPELGELPHPPEGVPAPFVRPDLPPRPSRASGSPSLAQAPERAIPDPPVSSSSVASEEASVEVQVAQKSNAEAILNGDEVPAVADTPLRAPVESPSMGLDELSDLEALITPAPKTTTQDPSLNVAGAPLLDPELMAELGVDPSQDHGGDIPFSAQDS